jgi:probable rRNA maturation factor
MKPIPRKVQRGSNRYNLEKQPITRSDGQGTRGRKYILINKQRQHAIDRKAMHRFLSDLVMDLEVHHRPFSVVFISDEAMRRYNRQYRGFDKPTDVLSFPGDYGYLGDILISSQTAYNQALKSVTLSFETNLRRLVLHGLLHLMGYDHETDEGQMRAFERRLRRRFKC